MARKILFRKVPMNVPPGEIVYGDMMLLILKTGPGGPSANRGLSLDDVLRAVETITPIEKAFEAKEDEVILTETQWQYLRDKVDAFQFGFADRAIADFGLMVRNAEEIGAEPEKLQRRAS